MYHTTDKLVWYVYTTDKIVRNMNLSTDNVVWYCYTHYLLCSSGRPHANSIKKMLLLK